MMFDLLSACTSPALLGTHVISQSSTPMATQSSILWPEHLLPGHTDNFISNEVKAADLTTQQIWELLADVSRWNSYYKNCAQITEPETGPYLKESSVFKFSTFGLPPLTCTVKKSVVPKQGTAGRLAWHTSTGVGFEVYLGWIVEELEKGRVRILTQEVQNGPIFKEAAKRRQIRSFWATKIGWMGLFRLRVVKKCEKLTWRASTSLYGNWIRRRYSRQ
ncbi:hypothetical protein PMIN07_000481 [Paraphaeosphaeria minitans]